VLKDNQKKFLHKTYIIKRFEYKKKEDTFKIHYLLNENDESKYLNIAGRTGFNFDFQP